MVRVDGDASDHRPDGEPDVADDEHALVAEQVAETSGEENEGADCETVACNEP